AARAKDVKAIVLRIDSPGGTYPAADAMADGVARARATGKPVIVSMGDIAASGGYLAAVRADVIVADPASITGSIGVFGVWPVAADLLNTLGVKVERVGVGTNAGMYSTFQAPTACCGWPASPPRRPRSVRRARCARPWRALASLPDRAMSGCLRCRHSGARGGGVRI